jgi:hypothetical protein
MLQTRNLNEERLSSWLTGTPCRDRRVQGLLQCRVEKAQAGPAVERRKGPLLFLDLDRFNVDDPLREPIGERFCCESENALGHE